jgi:hypothetical protein
MSRLPALTLLASLAPSMPATAATLVVDTSSDASLSACTPAPADCSLRGAITTANGSPDADVITFDLPESDPGFVPASAHWRIAPATALPALSGQLTIDGFSQPGAAPGTLAAHEGGIDALLRIELGGPALQGVNGLEAGATDFNAQVTLRGLAINGFNSQIVLHGGSAHRVEGCFLGTGIEGTSAAQTGNGLATIGVRLQGPGPYVIGGVTAAARNLISGLSTGISAFRQTNGLRIAGNLVGSNAEATAVIGNREYAIQLIESIDSTIGGGTLAERNVFAGNQLGAIRLGSGTNLPQVFGGTRIVGNYFGTDWTGLIALPNGLNTQSPSQPQPTILVQAGNPCGVQIGGSASGEANLIAHGGAAGVIVDSCSRVRISRNVFRANRGPAIDNVQGGGFVGPTPNDPGDPDDGGNRLQNFPVATGFGGITASNVELFYVVDSAPANATYPISVEFFRAQGGQAAEWIDTQTISLAQAQSVRNVTLPLAAFADGLVLMTAIDAQGNTSEFGRIGFGEVFADGFEP